MPEPESTTQILARCLEDFEERGEEAIEAACACPRHSPIGWARQRESSASSSVS